MAELGLVALIEWLVEIKQRLDALRTAAAAG
jgi:hypothetical protein